jgi:hypothetical protein
MIHAGFNELKRAFLVHSSASVDKDSISYNLLLFYAVESGLKAIYLNNTRLQTTNEIVDKKLWSGGGHDLNIWIKEIKMPASDIGHCRNFKLKRDKFQMTQSCSICHAHQAWRYSIEIDDNDQQELVRWLETIRNLIKEHI